MTLVAVTLGGFVIGCIMAKIVYDRDLQRFYTEKRKDYSLLSENHILVVEERNEHIRSLLEESKKLKKEIDKIHFKADELNQQKIVSETKVKEIEKEKELLYLAKIDEQLEKHSNTILEEFVEPLQKKIDHLHNIVEGKNQKYLNESVLINEELKRIQSSSVEFHGEFAKHIETSVSDIKKHITDRVSSTRPPQHIVCGTIP